MIKRLNNNKTKEPIFDKKMLMLKMNEEYGEKEFYSYFLKRKRKEKGLKLEDVASGICSISYLSRVENNQIVPDESSLSLLFERLDLNYNEVKTKREKNIFEEILKKDLLAVEEDKIEYINRVIGSNAYTTIELDLIVLFGSIIQKNYEEAKTILAKQNINIELFNNNEMIFFLYLGARYLYETNQNKKAYSQIKVLTSIPIKNEFLKAVIFDLAIDILFMMEDHTQLVTFYNLLLQNENSFLFSKKMNFHKMKIIYINSKYNYKEALEEIFKLKSSIDENLSLYNYYLMLTYYKNGLYNKSLEIAKENLNHIPSLIIYGHIVKMIGTEEEKKKFIDIFKKSYFSKYQNNYLDFCNYLNYAIKGESSYHLFSYLKQVVLNENTLFFDFMLKKIAVRELIEMGLMSSKYKETLRYILDKKII